MEDTKYNFTQKIITEIISESDKLTLSVINDYCKNNNIIPNIISEEKLKEVLELGIAKKIKIENLQSQLDIANNKLKEVKDHCENRINEYNNYKDRGCVDEKDYGIYLNSQKVLLIIGE